MTRKTAPKTQAALARALGVTRQAVSRWVAAGLPAPRAGRPWDLAAVRRWRDERAAARREVGNADMVAALERVDRVAQRDPAGFAAVARTYDERVRAGASPAALVRESVARFKFFRALEQEVRARVLAGELVRRDQVEDRAVALAATFRRLVLQIPARVDAELAAETDSMEVRRTLVAEIELMVADLAAAARVDLDAVRGRAAPATRRRSHRAPNRPE